MRFNLNEHPKTKYTICLTNCLEIWPSELHGMHTKRFIEKNSKRLSCKWNLVGVNPNSMIFSNILLAFSKMVS